MSIEGDTIFHKIIRKELPADIVYEDEDILAFKDIHPAAPVHVLLIPKQRSIAMLADAKESDAQLLGNMLLCANRIAKDLGIAESGYRVAINCGEGACQSVFQLHMHLLGGRDFSWPPG